MALVKVISGGQTGVDRGALVAARDLGFPLGGWVPKGARCEDHLKLLEEFPTMQEHESPRYQPRTACNVRDADATLIIYNGLSEMGPGTKLTFKMVEQYNRFLVEAPSLGTSTLREITQEVFDKLEECFSDKDFILNVAGPRGSSWDKGFLLSRGIVKGLIKLYG